MLPKAVPWSLKKQSHLPCQPWIGKVLSVRVARPEHVSEMVILEMSGGAGL